jgi:hypothetical protein
MVPAKVSDYSARSSDADVNAEFVLACASAATVFASSKPNYGRFGRQPADYP